MKYSYLKKMLTWALPALSLGAGAATAAPFTPGNVVVARVGDGTAPLSAAATAVFLDEYKPDGTLVQTIALPTFVSGNNRILTASGTSSAELALTRSADGQFLTLAGYGALPGTASISTSASADYARVIGLVAANGSIDTSTSTGDAFTGVSIRAAVTVDGTAFYSVGATGGVQYQLLNTFTPLQLTTTPANGRTIGVAGGNLYEVSSSSPYIGLSQVGSGLPTTATQTVTLLPGFPGSTAGSSPYGFYLADLSAAVPGVDVAYVADDRTSGGGIQKWSLVNGTWTLNGTITNTGSVAVRGLGGSTGTAGVSLVATSSSSNGSGSNLYFVSDNAGYNAAPSVAALPAATVTGATNTAFRGVAFAPVTAAPTISSFTPGSGRPGTTVTVTGTYLTGATAVRIGTLAVTSYQVVSATSLTFTVPASASAVSGPISVTTPGGTATSTASFNLVLGSLASQALPELRVYPNPATDYVQVELPQAGSFTVALRDQLGRQVLAPVALTSQQPLHLPASLAPGMYWLEVVQGTARAVRRIEKN